MRREKIKGYSSEGLERVEPEPTLLQKKNGRLIRAYLEFFPGDPR